MYKPITVFILSLLCAVDTSVQAQQFVDASEVFQKGLNYFYGRGIKPNEVEAVKLLTKAHEMGHMPATTALQNIYFNRGVLAERDKQYKTAQMYYELSAQLGDAKAREAFHAVKGRILKDLLDRREPDLDTKAINTLSACAQFMFRELGRIQKQSTQIDFTRQVANTNFGDLTVSYHNGSYQIHDINPESAKAIRDVFSAHSRFLVTVINESGEKNYLRTVVFRLR